MTIKSTPQYKPETYWSGVAEEMMKRGSQSYVAGDDTPFCKYLRQKHIDRFLDPIDFGSETVLEVGCGAGSNLKHILQQNPQRLIGVDISEKMLSLASQNLSEHSGFIELHKIDGMSLPFADQTTDITLTVTVLMHNTNEEMFCNLLQEMCRVSRKKLILIESTNPKMVQSPSAILRTVSVYQKACKSHGFRLAEVDYLETRCSRVCDRVTHNLWQVIDHSVRLEGEPLSTAFRFFNAPIIWVASKFDDYIPDNRGLTRMIFYRDDENTKKL